MTDGRTDGQICDTISRSACIALMARDKQAADSQPPGMIVKCYVQAVRIDENYAMTFRQ